MSTDYTKSDWFDEDFADFDLGDYELDKEEARNDKDRVVYESWQLSWRHGTIDVASPRVNQFYAIAAAKLFGYLYEKGVPCWVARDLTRSHILAMWNLAEKRISGSQVKETRDEPT